MAFDGLSSFYQVFFLLSNQRSSKRQRQSILLLSIWKYFNNFSSPSGRDQAWTLCLDEECLPNPHDPSFSMTSLLPVTTPMPPNLTFLLELAIYDLSVGLELKYNFFLEAFQLYSALCPIYVLPWLSQSFDHSHYHTMLYCSCYHTLVSLARLCSIRAGIMSLAHSVF